MADPSLQQLVASLPGILDHTAEQAEQWLLNLEMFRQVARSPVALGEHAEPIERDSSIKVLTQTADDVTTVLVESLKGVFGMQYRHADARITDSVLRHSRLHKALLQLLVVIVRWEPLAQPTAQERSASLATPQLQRKLAVEEGYDSLLSAFGTRHLLSSRFYLLGLFTFMLKRGADRLAESYSERSGTRSRADQGLGRRRVGPAASGALDAGGPKALDAPPTTVLALELGCALLRMHTLQCCSRQVAAVCARAGGGDKEHQQEQQEQQQQQQQLGGQEEQKRRAVEGQGQEGEQRVRADIVLEVVRSSLGLVDGLLALGGAAVGVMGRDEGPPSGGPGAAAAAAQHADCRRLSRRFLLLLASSLRDSHLLEHCARAAVVAAVGRQRCTPRSSACGEAAEGQGQGQVHGHRLAEEVSDNSLGALQAMFHDVMCSAEAARRLLKACEHAPAPVRAVVDPAVRQALTGTPMAYVALALGLRALCTADGGPEYGMPVSYRALPAEWARRELPSGEVHFSADFQIIFMVETLRLPELKDQLLELLGGVGPMLTLLLRVCELATRSAAVHGGRDDEEEGETDGDRGRGGRGRQGSSAPGGLRHVLVPLACLRLGLFVFDTAGTLLAECWGQQQVAARGESGRGGGRGHLAAGTADGGGGRTGVQGAGAGGEEAGGAEGPPVRAHEAKGAAGAAPEATRAAARCGGGGSEGRDSAMERTPTQPSAPRRAAPTAAEIQAAALDHQQAPGPAARRKRVLSAAALLAFQVRWWRCVCGAAEHMVLLRLPQEERELEVAAARELAACMTQLELPNPFEGRCSVPTGQRVAAATAIGPRAGGVG